jgi:hypothetical protein
MKNIDPRMLSGANEELISKGKKIKLPKTVFRNRTGITAFPLSEAFFDIS